ncbi:MAG TPA: 3-dehydroquinate synthase family protein [Bacilli bacterium]
MIVKYQNRTVEINVQEKLLQNISSILDVNKRYFILTDETVFQLYHSLFHDFINSFIYQIKPGEESKSIEVALVVIKLMLENNFDRSDTLIAFGGGVVGDLGGFIASLYKRGINYINIPTTLIAQVDSAFGGKVGVNYLNYKNQIGCFYHPSLILVDPTLIQTLTKIDFISGMCEVLKYAILFDKEMFYDIASNNYELLNIIERCIKYKINITLKDEYDNHERKLLNFGHTIGHAIEAKYHLPHGISIGYGMYLESKDERIKNALISLGLDFSTQFTDLSNYILKDKKISHQKITMVRIRDIGDAYIEEGDIYEYL